MNVISMRRSQCLAVGSLLVITVLVFWIISASFFTRPSVKKYYGSYHRRQSLNGSHFQPEPYVRHQSKPSVADLSPVWTFKPDFVEHNAPKSNASFAKPLIPHIIHQVWDTTMVPTIFSKHIPSWLAMNPGWQHWFWTLDDVRDLVARHYPDHLTLYDSYTAPIFRADVMRYFVLHRYGGVYVDLDMESLRPLDEWAANYNCLVTEENYEHSFVIREQEAPNLLNGFIACAAQHPFLEKVIESLDEAAMKYFGDYQFATGPEFFDAVWNKYADQRRGHTMRPGDQVTVLPPYYFLPTYDPSQSDIISGKCSPTNLRSLPAKSQIVCRYLAKRSFHNTIHHLAYANHYWVHSYLYGEDWKKVHIVSVFDLSPKIQQAYIVVKHLREI